MAKKRRASLSRTSAVLKQHFRGYDLTELVTASRQYPIPARVDLQRATDELLPKMAGARQFGIHAEYMHETLSLGHLIGNRQQPVVVGPLQYEEIDIGETLPARAVKQALWLAREGKTPFALVTVPAVRFGTSPGTHLEIVTPPTEAGANIARRLLDAIELRVRVASSYRGRVISLGAADRYSGAMGAIRVHKLRTVSRDQLVLPPKTAELLERNVIGFVEQREKLKALGLPARKGLLFYGPPGTGKTHTIHYLANQLPGHTTMLITAEEVGLIEHYFQLARFLQPSIVILEDADLIARSRERMNGPCEEVLLNKLLNEMDGLREDAEILFVLTTNRPEELEAALSARPGRIDQAIEFPLPDDRGRRLLAELYAQGLNLKKPVLDAIVSRTAGASAAFIKELMRRSAQFLIEAKASELDSTHVTAALEEMLFAGGSLNAKLLGATQAIGQP